MATTKRASSIGATVRHIQKRDGSIVPFDIQKITNAVNKAMLASGEGSLAQAGTIAAKVHVDALRITGKYKNFVPTVEGIQDTVENELVLSGYAKTTKAYILYRESRSKLRAKGLRVPPALR